MDTITGADIIGQLYMHGILVMSVGATQDGFPVIELDYTGWHVVLDGQNWNLYSNYERNEVIDTTPAIGFGVEGRAIMFDAIAHMIQSNLG